MFWGGGYHYLSSKKYGLIFACLLTAGIFSTLGLFSLGWPSLLESKAHAETASTTLNFTIVPTISISATDAEFDITPVAGSTAFSTGSSTVSVTTSNPSGYTLSMNGTVAGATEAANLHNSVSNTDISPITSSGITASSADFTANTWGYSTTAPSESTLYNPVPLTSVQIAKKYTALTQDETPVYFGVKVGDNTMAGDYIGTVVFTAVANYMPSSDNTATIDSTTTEINTDGGDVKIVTDINYLTAEELGTVTGYISDGTTTINCASVTPSQNATTGKLDLTCAVPTQATTGSSFKATVTVFSKFYTTNNTLTIKVAEPPVITSCSQLSTHEKGIYNDYTVIKMADGKCWDATDRRNYINWTDAKSVCTGNFAQPNNAVINALMSAEGSGGQIYSYWDLSDGYYFYWSSEELSSSSGYGLYVDSGRALLSNGLKNNSGSNRLVVRCYTIS